jgi:hypothetical protein
MMRDASSISEHHPSLDRQSPLGWMAVTSGVETGTRVAPDVFEIIAGKNIPQEGAAKVFAGVRRIDSKPKRRCTRCSRRKALFPDNR